MLDTIADTVATRFYELVAMVVLVVVVYLISRTILRWSETKNSVRLSELAIQREKLSLMKRKEMLRDLADASVVLNDDERERLDAIKEDIAALSRKNLAIMGEIEAKTTRLERGADLAKMQDQARRIFDQERRLFGIKED